MTGALLKRGNRDTETHTEERRCEDTGRRQQWVLSDVSRSEGMLRIVSIHQKLQELFYIYFFLISAFTFVVCHAWMWELDHKESWAPKNWCFWTMVLEKTLESPLHCKEIKPVNPKGNQSWICTERTEAEAPIVWPLDVKTDSLEKTLMLGKIESGRRGGQQRMRWLDGITD